MTGCMWSVITVLIFMVIKFQSYIIKGKIPMFSETACTCINMTACIKVSDHDPNIHKNETEMKPQVICCKNSDTYISYNL